MTDRNLELTPEEKTALEQDNLMMGLLKEANAGQPVSFASLFPDAIPISTLSYWSTIQRTDAVAHLKQAIAAGANVNEHSGDGYTALHGAAENGCIVNVKILLANGADVTIKTATGKTPVDFAKLQGHHAIVDLMEPATTPQTERPWWKFW
jgi:ankyrin repeat protein